MYCNMYMYTSNIHTLDSIMTHNNDSSVTCLVCLKMSKCAMYGKIDCFMLVLCNVTSVKFSIFVMDPLFSSRANDPKVYSEMNEQNRKCLVYAERFTVI